MDYVFERSGSNLYKLKHQPESDLTWKKETERKKERKKKKENGILLHDEMNSMAFLLQIFFANCIFITDDWSDHFSTAAKPPINKSACKW